MRRDWAGNTDPVSVDLERGVRFAAKFIVTRVKPSYCWTEAEARSFAGNSKMRRGSHRAATMTWTGKQSFTAQLTKGGAGKTELLSSKLAGKRGFCRIWFIDRIVCTVLTASVHQWIQFCALVGFFWRACNMRVVWGYFTGGLNTVGSDINVAY